MAKKNPSIAPAATTSTETKSKAQSIKEYAKANPNAKPAEIAKALTAAGIKVSSGRVANVLNRSKPSINVEAIKSAAAFVKGYKGEVMEAAAAIESVGGFIDSCGSASAALLALEAYQAIAEAVA